MKKTLYVALVAWLVGITSMQVQAAQASKDYRVPGPVLISAAKRHGYLFGQTIRFSADSSKCTFQGMNWTVKSGGTCVLHGLASENYRCVHLRRGWTVKNIRFKGLPYVWKVRPEGKTEPKFSVQVKNSASVSKAFVIDYVTLTGPSGPFKDFEKAFSHCSE